MNKTIGQSQALSTLFDFMPGCDKVILHQILHVKIPTTITPRCEENLNMASLPATLSDSVNTLVRDYLVCPERSHECGQQFIVGENKLSCACGRIYPLESGVAALRPIDIIDEFKNKPIKNPAENRYCETPFVNTYIVRQYGPLLRRTP